MKKQILIADDEEIVVRSCLRILSAKEFDIDTVSNGLEAIEKVAEKEYDLLILDIMMPKMSGMEVLQRVKETHPDIDVIMITGLNQIETAVEAMKLGAFDYLPKPFDPEELEMVVERALERRQLLQENVNLKREVSARYSFENIIGSSPPMQNVYRLIARCAPTNSTVMLRGESGTGKELIARAIHFNSLRKDKPFITVDCASLSENLLESELFGHVKGSFTGAVANKKGLLEEADGGTLFLDEIGNISLSTQAKLLRFIQEKEFKAVGDTKPRMVNIRLITATNKDLEGMVGEETFRDDLYYRINIFPIEIPPLRERRDDIPALSFHFLKQFSKEIDRKVTEFSGGAMNLLMNHDWPGNVRELENVIHRAVILTSDSIIRQAHLVNILDMQPLSGMGVPRTNEELKRIKKVARQKSVEDIEKLFVLSALKRNQWSVTESAEDTGMQRSNFQALMKKYDIRIRGKSTGDSDNGS
ncbi:MAG: sigma-54 dependent transcriptional regulator [Gammaproteobacteria bacterium]|nr:sigma-54 dependent transcriptional regulator [Gammaproteobacteria bacterium]NNK98676.1 sigma-54-dependent Fis family transcriptional regulator [Xanthomonadales bacterium]